MMKVQYNNVACHLFTPTVDNKATTSYHLLPVASILTWDEFWKTFLDKFSKGKTPSMLLTELSRLKCHKKENVKYLNQWFTTILNKFPMDVALDDSIMIDYYTSSLPHDIVIFIKCEENITLVENFATVLEVEKEFLSIGTLEHESQEEEKTSDKKNQTSSIKTRDKDNDSFDFEGLEKSLK